MPSTPAPAPQEPSLVRTAFVRWQAVLGALRGGLPGGPQRPAPRPDGVVEVAQSVEPQPVEPQPQVGVPAAPLPSASGAPVRTGSSQDER